VVLFGTTGEGPSFSVEERLETLEETIKLGVEPRNIILGNGGANIPDTVKLTLGGLKNTIAGLLIAPPTFFKNVSEEGVIAFYREIIHRIANPKLRLILYHIPQLSGVPITMHIIDTLRKEFPTIVVGIKESEGNPAFANAILKTFPGFKV